MKATVLMPLSAIWPLIAVAICESFCGVLNTQRRLTTIGSTIAEEAAIEIIGVSDSAATSIIASEAGVTVEPTSRSTFSSDTSLRAFLTAVVVSVASSSTMYCTLLPAIFFGSSEMVFFSGMPSEAAGPVADTVTPTLICAEAAVDMAREISAGSRAAANLVFIVISPFRFHRCRLLHLLVFYSYQ